MPESPSTYTKADRIDRLLYLCAGAAVLTTVLQLAEHHYVRAVVAGLLFLLVVPWLGRKLINRWADQAGRRQLPEE